MADKIQLLLEAERRGILPADKKGLLDEARKRGLIPGGEIAQPDPNGQWTDMAIPYDMAAPGATNVDYGDTYGPGVSFLRSVGQGAMLGFGDEIGGALKGYVPALVSGKDPQAEYQRVRDSYRKQSEMEAAKNPIATTAGNVTGQVATGAGAALATGGTSLPAMLALGAGQGAVTGLGESEATSAGDMAMDALQGGAVGAGGALAGAGVGKVLKSVVAPTVSKGVKTLMGKGVTPTMGQIVGGKLGAVENKLTSVPFIGDLIKGAQNRSVEQFNKAALNEVLAPIGKQVDDIGRVGIDKVDEALSSAYDDILPKMTFQTDAPLKAELANLLSMAKELPEPQFKQFSSIIKNKVVARLSDTGAMDGQTFKGVESELGRLARGYMGDVSFDQRQLGAAIDALRTSMRDSLARTNPALAPELGKINSAYARFVRVRDAASRVGAGEGVFTPAQLQSAVRAADKSAGKGKFAKGDALMQDLSEAGKSVLTTYPDSGTAGRVAAGYLGLGGLGTVEPVSASVLGLSTLPYTKAGQSLLASLLTKRPAGAETLGRAIQAAGPALGVGGALGLLGLGAP